MSTQRDRLLKLLNTTLGTNYTENVYFTDPLPNPDTDVPRNTMVYVSVLDGGQYRNLQLYYNRNSIRKELAVSGNKVQFETLPDNTMLVSELATKRKWEITQDDILTHVIGFGDYVLEVDEDNFGWYDNAPVTLTGIRHSIPEPDGTDFMVKVEGGWVEGLSADDVDSLLHLKARRVSDATVETWSGSGF